MIENLLTVGWSNALVAMGLAVVVLLVTRIWRHAPLAHLLWFVVLLKLVTPPLFSWDISSPAPLAGGDIESSQRHAADENEIAGAVAVVPLSESLIDLHNTAANGTTTGVPPPRDQRGAAWAMFADSWLTRSSVATAIWLSGALVLMAIVLLRVHRFRGILRRAAAAPQELRDEVAQLAELAEVRSLPDVRVSEARVVPLVFGVGGRAVLLLPKSLLSSLERDERTTMLAHELAHLRRRDHWLTWFTMLVATVYWWHPVVWFARRQLRRAADQCCDGWVVKWFPDKSVPYTESMMQALDYLATNPHRTVGVASEFGQLSFLKERFDMVLRDCTSHRLGWYVRLPATAIAVPLLLVSPLVALTEVSRQDGQSGQQEAETRTEGGKLQGESEPKNTSKPDDKKAVAALERFGTMMQENEEGNVLAFGFHKQPTAEAIKSLKGLPLLEGVGLQGSATSGADLAFLKELPKLKSLWLDDEQLDKEGLSHIRQLPRLDKLFLDGEGINDAAIALLEELPLVSFLHLKGTRVTTDGLKRLGNLKNLESFSVSNLDWERRHPNEPQFTDDILARLAGLDNLKSLNLHFGTRVSDDGLKHLAGLKKLEVLKLYGDQITDAGLAHVGQLSNLKSLSIDAPRVLSSFSRRSRSIPQPNFTDAGLAHLHGLVELEVLSIRNGQFTDAGMAYLAPLVNLKNLSLYRAPIGDEGLSHLKDLVNLERFTFFGTQITDDGLKHLAEMTKLRTLNLSRSDVSAEGLEAIAGMINLTFLTLDGTDVTDVGLAHLRGLTKLTHLSLNDTRIRGEGLAHLSGCAKLSSLRLGRTHLNDESLKHLAALPSLQTLWLNSTAASDAGMVHLRALAELQTLSLTGTRITDEGLQHLTVLEKLRFLTLGGGQLTDQGMEHVGEMSSLHSLHIHDAQITNAGMEHLGQLVNLSNLSVDHCRDVADESLAHLKDLTKLETLHLNDTGITGAGFEHLKELSNVNWVSLYKCRIDDAGLQHIGKLSGLKMLNLTDNGITDDGLKHLAGLQNLTRLQLERTLVTDEGVKRLEETLPNTDVIH